MEENGAKKLSNWCRKVSDGVCVCGYVCVCTCVSTIFQVQPYQFSFWVSETVLCDTMSSTEITFPLC